MARHFKRRTAMGSGNVPEARSLVVARADNVYKTLGDTAVLHGVSLEVNAGEMVVLTGPSGSGKTTLIRAFQGIDPPSSGHVELFGRQLDALAEKDQDRLLRDYAGISFQTANLDTNHSAWNNVLGLSEARGVTADRKMAANILWTLGFRTQDVFDRKAGDYSGGQQQKIAFARMLLPLMQQSEHPGILLLDEPTASLDPSNKGDMFNAIATVCHKDGMSALVVTHDLGPARQFADREYEMSSGRILNEINYAHEGVREAMLAASAASFPG